MDLEKPLPLPTALNIDRVAFVVEYVDPMSVGFTWETGSAESGYDDHGCDGIECTLAFGQGAAFVYVCFLATVEL